MNLYFFTESRFDRVNNEIWTSQGFSMALWQRYLSRFDRVYVVARVQNVASRSGDNLFKLEDHRVSVIDLPYYIGLKPYLKVQSNIKKSSSLLFIQVTLIFAEFLETSGR